MKIDKTKYCDAIREGFEYIFSTDEKSFAIGQGLWSPWYVGNSMLDLDKKFGRSRIIDSPVSELAVTGAAVGASLNGYRPIVIHPRMDFMILAMDQIVNQAAKWHHMMGGAMSPSLTIRSIINRGGEQGAQHSQALHSWLAHIPGLRVLMPATAQDARDMLIAAHLSDDPVVYIDDRWCYDHEERLDPVSEINISEICAKIIQLGCDVTIAGAGYPVLQILDAAQTLKEKFDISVEVVDIRQLNPILPKELISSVKKTKRLIAVDGGWSNSGFANEIIQSTLDELKLSDLEALPERLALPPAPAPTSKSLEQKYYINANQIIDCAIKMMRK